MLITGPVPLNGIAPGLTVPLNGPVPVRFKVNVVLLPAQTVAEPEITPNGRSKMVTVEMPVRSDGLASQLASLSAAIVKLVFAEGDTLTLNTGPAPLNGMAPGLSVPLNGPVPVTVTVTVVDVPSHVVGEPLITAVGVVNVLIAALPVIVLVQPPGTVVAMTV